MTLFLALTGLQEPLEPPPRKPPQAAAPLHPRPLPAVSNPAPAASGSHGAQTQQRIAAQRQVARACAEREARMSAGRGESGPAASPPENAQSAAFLPGFSEGGRSGGDGREGESEDGPAGSQRAGLADGDLDSELLMDMLPTDGDSGIFEILMPGGDRLAVVADVRERQASFLMTPSSERLRSLLQRKKMELESGLARRMGRHVRLTVL